MFEKIENYTKDGNLVSKLANIASICYEELEDINWIGFYFYNLDFKALVLGPFQGKAAVNVIKEDEGICGQAFKEGKTIIVKDVHECPNHIACDLASNSELVIPIKKDHQVVAIFDIDSPIKDRFDEKTISKLEKVAKIIENFI